MSKVVHFELSSTDIPATREFMTNLLGWSWQEMQPDYVFAITGNDEKPGINGALMPAYPDQPQAALACIGVENLDASIAKAVENGAVVVMEKQTVPTMGYWAYLREPGGALVQIWQGDESAA